MYLDWYFQNWHLMYCYPDSKHNLRSFIPILRIIYALLWRPGITAVWSLHIFGMNFGTVSGRPTRCHHVFPITDRLRQHDRVSHDRLTLSALYMKKLHYLLGIFIFICVLNLLIYPIFILSPKYVPQDLNKWRCAFVTTLLDYVGIIICSLVCLNNNNH